MTFDTYYKEHFQSKNEAAKILRISRPLVYKLLAGKPVERKVAVRIESITQRKLLAADLMQL